MNPGTPNYRSIKITCRSKTKNNPLSTPLGGISKNNPLFKLRGAANLILIKREKEGAYFSGRSWLFQHMANEENGKIVKAQSNYLNLKKMCL